MMAKEELVMDGFAGQMYLCDFGAHIADCPGPGCRGPHGTDITGPRLYDWSSIVSRNFVKDSLKTLFPDKIKEIDEKIDPGEYGIESYYCRLVCCFIFMVSCMGELVVTYKMAQLIYKIPTKNEPWIVPNETLSKEVGVRRATCRQLLGDDGTKRVGAIDEVHVKIAGMPLFWKIVNFLFVCLPKFILWKLTAETGITVLMDTAGIADIITNSVGLTFILSIDELIGQALMAEETQKFVAATEAYPLFDETTSCVGDMTTMSEDEIMAKYHETQHGCCAWGFWDLVYFIPIKLIFAIAGTAGFVYNYYHAHCEANPDDAYRLISKTRYQPATPEFSWLNAFLPTVFPLKLGPIVWEMPD
jgi:hypothetical protein